MTARKSSFRKPGRTARSTVFTYVLLIFVAAMMIFPFVFMFFASLKTPDDVFNYPPRVLPYDQDTATFEGEDLPLFVVSIDGEDVKAVLVEEGIPAGLFGLSEDPEDTIAWPLDLVEATGETAVVDGEELEVFLVPVDGEVRQLPKLRDSSVARFVDPDNPEAEAFGVGRTTERAETISAHWSNYDEVFGVRNFDRSLTNTVLVTILVVGGQLFTSIMGGYAFSRLRWPGRDVLFVGYLGSIMIPFVVLIIPLFQIMVQLNWNNTLGSLVWPFVFTAYGTFLMRQFFLSIPTDLEEAALVDGASRMRILWRIFVPLSWPAIATLATFSFLYAWNSFIWPLVTIDAGNTDDGVLTLALRALGGQGADDPQLIFAGVTLAMLVPMIVFVMAQRYFVENVASSGLK